MAEKNTPLTNELLHQVGHHCEFESWRKKGKIPSGIVKELCQPLKTDPRFTGQPGRFYTSAIALVSYIYKSWLVLMKRSHYKLEGKTRWLEMLSSDAELVERCGISVDGIRARASEILAQLALPDSADTGQVKGRKAKKSKKFQQQQDRDRNLSRTLFEAYRDTEDILTRCAICYLLKNGCQVSDREENSEKFTQRRRQVEIQIERLKEKLAARIPKGRDLTDAKWLETLFLATSHAPESEAEAKLWQDCLLRQPSSVPFPVAYETSEDMTWFKNHKGRISVKFNGLSEHTFEVYCDSRQLHWFERFLEDQQIKRNNQNQYSSSLFTLRSSRIAWQEGKGKGEPWNFNHLTLYCSVDTRLWTAEGTQLVIEEKVEEIVKNITNTKDKGNLNEKQLAHIQRKNSTLARITNPFPRPSKSIYRGQSHILVGVSLGLEKPATVAVVDATTSNVIAYRSIKQLLGDNYRLLNRQRQQKQVLSHQRHLAQRLDALNSLGESELGQYVDRLLAKEIVAIAQTYCAGSIVLPSLGDMREQVQSEIQAKAEQKSDLIEVQQKYAKQYRASVHQWSYGRLISSIQSQAKKAGIAIEEAKQPIRGSPQQKAKELVIAAYNARKTS
jgi:IS605 OrfB family transposase